MVGETPHYVPDSSSIVDSPSTAALNASARGLGQRIKSLTLDETAKAIRTHTESEWHFGRFRLSAYGCDMGVPGTALTLTGIWGHRVMEFPVETFNWKLLASPASGSCVVDVLKAADLDAFNAGTYSSVCDAGKLTLTTARRASGAAISVWPITMWLPGEVMVWRLVSISGSIEVLTAQLGIRRT